MLSRFLLTIGCMFLLILLQAQQDSVLVQERLRLSERFLQANPNSHEDSALLYASAAESLARAAHDDKGLGDALIQESRIIRFKDQVPRAKEMVQDAIQAYTRAGRLTELGFAWYELSGYYPLEGDGMIERIRLAEISVQTFQQAGNTKKEADGLKELGDLLQIHGDYPLALVKLKRSVELFISVNQVAMEGVYDVLGDVYTAMGDLKEGLHYGLLALRTAQRNGNNPNMQLCTIYNHLAINYFFQEDFASSARYRLMSLHIAETFHSVNDIAMLTINYAHTVSRFGDYPEAVRILEQVRNRYNITDLDEQIQITSFLLLSYIALNLDVKAKEAYDELGRLTQGKDLNDESIHVTQTANISYLTAMHRFDEARVILVAQEKLANINGSLIYKTANAAQWYKLDSTEGNFLGALQHFISYKRFNDSLYTQQKSKQLAQINVQYETESKDRELVLKQTNIELLTKQSLLQHTVLSRAMLVRNITFAGLSLLLVILGLMYSRYRLKQRSNQVFADQNARLQHLVAEKEWLLKEIHHRVKNNLQIVMSLLESQSQYLEHDPAALQAISESQDRVQAMSLIHKKLYQSDHVSFINMQEYILELVEYLRDGFDTGQRIRFNTDIEALDLDVTQAIPIGLILNEAITNSIKYAFPDQRAGIISITLRKLQTPLLELLISDDGIGVSAGTEGRPGLGMSLMKGLSAEIDAELLIDGNAGTSIRMSFANAHPSAQSFAEKTYLTTAT